MTQAPPDFDEVLQLPLRVETVVWREHIDANGHMNTRHHFAFTSDAIAVTVHEAGVDHRYRDRRRMGLFTAEQHMRYFAELVEGTRLSVHVRALDRSERSVHLIALLVDRDRRRVASSLEVVAVHVDLTTRRSVPMPPDIAAAFDLLVKDSAALPWPTATSGSLGIRTSASTP